MTVQTYWLERTDFVAVGLRRYTNGTDGFDCEHGHHRALVYTGVEPAAYRIDEEFGGRKFLELRTPVGYDDPRWPVKCEHCREYVFAPDDHWQDWQEQIYQRSDQGQRVLHQGAPAHELGLPAAEPGACWDAWWMPSSMRQADGMYLMVRLPDGHDWAVDSRASNCTLPDDDEHRCWVRHGDPHDCHLTVDKNGLTCSAGAGSIGSPGWHGFLRNGQLVE